MKCIPAVKYLGKIKYINRFERLEIFCLKTFMIYNKSLIQFFILVYSNEIIDKRRRREAV